MIKIGNWHEFKSNRYLTGVCEGAVSHWLYLIMKENLEAANRLRPEQCEELHSMAVGDGGIQTGYFHTLLDSLYYSLLQNLSGLVNATSSATQENIEKDELCRKINEHFAVQNLHSYLAIILSRPEGGGHVVAFYCDHHNNFFYFDPNLGFYAGTLSEIIDIICTRTTYYTGIVTFCSGTF